MTVLLMWMDPIHKRRRRFHGFDVVLLVTMIDILNSCGTGRQMKTTSPSEINHQCCDVSRHPLVGIYIYIYIIHGAFLLLSSYCCQKPVILKLGFFCILWIESITFILVRWLSCTRATMWHYLIPCLCNGSYVIYTCISILLNFNVIWSLWEVWSNSALLISKQSQNVLFFFQYRKVNKSYRGRSCPIVVHCRSVCNCWTWNEVLVDVAYSQLCLSSCAGV
jgi:hypothetical protein